MMKNSKIQVSKLVLQETGTYNIQYYRPYQVTFSAQATNKFALQVEESLKYSAKLPVDMIASLNEHVIAPQASPQAPIAIPNGWSNPRIRFVMEVYATSSLGTQSIYYVQGYTNYNGVIAATGAIDPKMLFIINSVFVLNRKLQRTPTGNQYVDSLQNCSHLLVSPATLDPTATNSLYTIRPTDLFAFMQTHLGDYSKGYNAYDASDNGYVPGLVPQQQIISGSSPLMIDTRLMTPNDFYRPTERANGSPSAYLTQTLNAGLMGHLSNTDSMSFASVGMESARSQLMQNDNFISQTDFMRSLNNYNYENSRGISSMFNLGQLAAVDPNIYNVTNYLALDPSRKASLHQAGLTSHWSGSDMDTQIAATLASAVPAIMSDCLISSIQFRSTNHSVDAKMFTQIIDGKSLSNTTLVHMFELFKNRIEREIISDFTYGNQIAYTLDVKCDMFGDTIIQINTDSNPVTTYVVPSFCDSVFTPIANTDPNLVAYNGKSVSTMVDVLIASANEVQGRNIPYSVPTPTSPNSAF
jgi:hypothetical protein